MSPTNTYNVILYLWLIHQSAISCWSFDQPSLTRLFFVTDTGPVCHELRERYQVSLFRPKGSREQNQVRSPGSLNRSPGSLQVFPGYKQRSSGSSWKIDRPLFSRHSTGSYVWTRTSVLQPWLSKSRPPSPRMSCILDRTRTTVLSKWFSEPRQWSSLPQQLLWFRRPLSCWVLRLRCNFSES